MVVEVLVPVLGLGVEKVEIVKFYKKEGERVEKGEPLVQVITSRSLLILKPRLLVL